jgi:hypothetical protein
LLRRGRESDSYKITLIMAFLSYNILSASYLVFVIEKISLLIKISTEVERNERKQRNFSFASKDVDTHILEIIMKTKSDTLRRDWRFVKNEARMKLNQ